MSNIQYKALKKRLVTAENRLLPGEKNMASSWLDSYLATLGWTDESIKYLFNPCEEHSWEELFDSVDLCVDLSTKIKEGKNKICIIADYDADGVTSCTILTLILSKIGFDVHYYVPHRIEDGYGMSRNIVDKIHTMHPEDTSIITCDNGIVALDAIKYAKSLDYSVYITDHHEPNEDLQDVLFTADGVVHPALMDYPFRDISGAEVAYKIAQGLMEYFDIQDEELSAYLLQLATVSIVSDVMPLASVDNMANNENRGLLIKGLKSFHDSPNWHWTSLFEMMKINVKEMDETTIGFYVAPVINAVGRLSCAKTAVDLLTCSKPEEAQLYASVMVYFNEERKQMKADVMKRLHPDTSKSAILVKDKFIHEGLVGIIAGNYCEDYRKPTFVMAECTVDGQKAWKGSARSIPEVNCFELLSTIQQQSNCILKFGGHAGAAGLTVMDDQMDVFEELLMENVEDMLGDAPESVKCYIPLQLKDLEDFAKESLCLKPMGEGLPRPLVGFQCKITSIDYFYSSGHVKLTVWIPTGGKPKALEIWQYWALDKISNDADFTKGFEKEKDNLEKRNETMTSQEAYQGRWEHWRCKDSNTFQFYAYLDYGELMNQITTIVNPEEIIRID